MLYGARVGLGWTLEEPLLSRRAAGGAEVLREVVFFSESLGCLVAQSAQVRSQGRGTEPRIWLCSECVACLDSLPVSPCPLPHSLTHLYTYELFLRKFFL